MTREARYRTAVCLSLVLAGCIVVHSARAEAPVEVAVVTPDPSTPLAIRVATELRQLGLKVIFVRQPDVDTMSPASLEAAAQGVGAFAAVRVVRSGPAVEVWIADRTTGKTVVREVVSPNQVGSDADVALGAVELLRASLLELQVPERKALGDVEPAPEVLEVAPPIPAPVQPVAEESNRGLTTAALGAVFDPGLGGFEVAYGPQVLVAHRFGALFGLEGTGGLVFGEVDEEPRASASTTVGFVGLSGFVAPELGRVEPRGGVGFAVVHVQSQGVTGTEETRYLANDTHAWLIAGSVRAGAALELHKSIRWRVDSSLLLSTRRAVIEFDDERVATWGGPSLLASTSLELVVP